MFGSSKATQDLQDRQTYIPPHIEGAMTEHVQNSMPAHLQKYRGGNTYIPEHAQTEMTEHLENNLPPHMKEYAGAYMQQRVVEPSIMRRGAVTPPMPPGDSSASPHAPIVQSGVQPNPAGQPPTTPASAPAPALAQVVSPTGQPAPANPDQQYEFITNPGTIPPKPGLSSSLNSSSMLVRAALIGGGILILLVLFVIGRSLLGGSSNVDSFLTIAQEQQELIHLVSGTTTDQQQDQTLSPSTQNLAATMEASLNSSQGATIKYMTTNGKKVNPKQLNLKVSAATDTQLTDAAGAGTYNRTFREIIATKLAAYSRTLSQAYNQNPGPKGKALLKDSYTQAQLFQTQLQQTTD